MTTIGARLVVGVGTPMRGDDEAGWAVVEALESLASAAFAVARSTGDPAGLLDLFTRAPRVVLVDAMRSGLPPGTIRHFDACRAPLPASVGASASSHAWGVVEAVELARALGRLPASLAVIGIEGGDFSPGSGLSPAVAAAVRCVVRDLSEGAGSPRAGRRSRPRRSGPTAA